MLAANVVKDLLSHREVLVQGFNELDARFEQKVVALEDAQKRATAAEYELRHAPPSAAVDAKLENAPFQQLDPTLDMPAPFMLTIDAWVRLIWQFAPKLVQGKTIYSCGLDLVEHYEPGPMIGMSDDWEFWQELEAAMSDLKRDKTEAEAAQQSVIH